MELALIADADGGGGFGGAGSSAEQLSRPVDARAGEKIVRGNAHGGAERADEVRRIHELVEGEQGTRARILSRETGLPDDELPSPDPGAGGVDHGVVEQHDVEARRAVSAHVAVHLAALLELDDPGVLDVGRASVDEIRASGVRSGTGWDCSDRRRGPRPRTLLRPSRARTRTRSRRSC